MIVGRAGPVCLPVHGELSDQGDIRVVRSGLILIVQEVKVGSVDGEPLSPELVTQVILIKFRELLLELKSRRRGRGGCAYGIKKVSSRELGACLWLSWLFTGFC